MLFTHRHLIRRCAFVLFAGIALPLAATAQTPPAGAARPPVTTGYVVLQKAEVPVSIRLTGRAVAANTTQIRPRVGGMIREILYTPGSRVAAGDPLFRIDPLTYEVALKVAEANSARAKADLATAEAAFERAERLQGSVTSRATFEAVETTLLKARASLGEAEANLALAQAQLDWTTVRAPAAGVAGIAEVAIGDLVSAAQATALTEIVRIDPIYVDLTEPYPLRMRLEADAAEGKVTLREPELSLVLNTGARIDSPATLLSTGATVSATTGTRRLRFSVANPEGHISPGMFVAADMTLGTTVAILVPQRAAVRLRDGTLSAWIAKDGKAEQRRITENGSYKNHWIITGGLSEGEWLMIDGINTMRDGQAVTPVPAEIDAMGVVRDVTDPAKVGN